MEAQDTQKTDPETNWEKRAKDTQASYTKSQQELKAANEKAEAAQATVVEYEELIGRMAPAMDYNKFQGNETPVDDTPPPVTQKDFNAYTQRMDLLLKFRTDPKYADIRQFEDRLGGIFQNLSTKLPQLPANQLFDKAVEAVRKQATDIEAAVRAKIDAETKAKEVEEKEKSAKEAEAAGLDSEHGPEAPEAKPETPQSYVDNLKAQQAKRKGVIV